MLEYLKAQRVCVLAVKMLDGGVHAATVHYVLSEGSLSFVFETGSDSRKAESVVAKGDTLASVVVGFVEGVGAKTVQFDGCVRLLKEGSDKENLYYGKFPEKKGRHGPTAILLEFVPSWWRYTDWGRPEGKTALTDDGEMRVVRPAK